MSELAEGNPVSIDWTRVAAWLDSVSIAGSGVDDVEALAGGTQNPMFRFTRGGRDYVLRRPPLHKRRTSDTALRREIRVLGALAGEAVPHPRLIVACDDEDVIGSIFYVMEAIDGFNALNGLPELHRSDAAIRHQMGLNMVDAIAALGEVDVAAVGLADFGKGEGFLQRQPQRWLDELRGYSNLPGYSNSPGDRHQLPDLQPLADWLTENMPAPAAPGLMHGDFHLGNVMFSPRGAELVAVIDWEMCTVGDPLLDLGWLLATWPVLPPQELEPADGFASKQELVARYASRSSRSVADIRWYEVLANYKLGIVLEGTHARACAGLAPKEIGQRLHGMAQTLIGNAFALIGR